MSYSLAFSPKEIDKNLFEYRAAMLWNHLFDILEINFFVVCLKNYAKSYFVNNGGLDMLDLRLL